MGIFPILHILFSEVFSVLNGKLLSIVKSQSLERRGVLYEVTIKHSPKSKRRQHGKGLGKKFEFRAPFEIHCNCIAFNSMCKHAAALLMVNFNK